MWRPAVERLACVNAAAFPLQLLLRDHPDWRELPVAVVEDDRPKAFVLYVNARAHRAGVRTGQRYTTALAIERHLRAGVVSPLRVDAAVHMLTDRLRRHAPRIEPASGLPGVFWLDVSGFGRLHPSLHAWAEKVRVDLEEAGIRASIVVGFSRFGVYGLSIARRGVVVCATSEEERAAIHQVPLGRLDLDPDARNRLLALGIRTVGDFLRLPGDGVRARFGAAVGLLHQLAAGQRVPPLVPAPADEVHERVIDFDAPERHVERLLFIVKRLVDGLAAALAHRGLAVIELTLHLTLDDRTTRVEHVRPAAPTLDVAQLLTLIRLRLDNLHLASGIVTLRVTADVCPATADARRLFATRRDPEAADQALARLRAECGEQCVVRAKLCDAHLPAARFIWEPILHVPASSSPRAVAARPLVRRIYTRALMLAPGFRLQASAGLQAPGPRLQAQGSSGFSKSFCRSPEPGARSPAEARSLEPGALSGPYLLSGGWWTDDEGRGVRRDYYFVHTPQGDLWWIYYDHRRRGFLLQGCVE